MLLAFQWTILFFYKGLNYPATGLRQFCVEIAPPFDWRNIDAALLREHSVRRICAHYKVCKFCVISSFASTHASNLRKKKTAKKWRMRQKKQKKIIPWPDSNPGPFVSLAAALPTLPSPLYVPSGKIWPLYTYIHECAKLAYAHKCAKLAYAHKLRTIGVCAQIAQI